MIKRFQFNKLPCKIKSENYHLSYRDPEELIIGMRGL